MSRKSRRQQAAAGTPATPPPSRRAQAIAAHRAVQQAAYQESLDAAERIQNLPIALERRQDLEKLIREWAKSMDLEIGTMRSQWNTFQRSWSHICNASFRAFGGDIDEQFSADLYHDDITGKDSVSVFLAADKSRSCGDVQGPAGRIEDQADLGAALQRADIYSHRHDYG